MTNFNNFSRVQRLLFAAIWIWPGLAFAHLAGDPTRPDSLARLGHCTTVIVADTNCATHKVTLSAFVDWTFTGIRQPVVPIWSNGLAAHKISVSPPGTWSWDANGTSAGSCEPWHSFNSITIEGSFFEDSIDIMGPTSLCDYDDPQELTTNINGYSEFIDFVWSPPNPAGIAEPYPISGPGTISLMVTDAFGCMTSDQITIIDIPPVSATLIGPLRMCPEGDTGVVSVQNPGLFTNIQWENGEMTPEITINEPGNYQVTVTESHGCTGFGSISVPSGEVSPFSISSSSPGLCPGQRDTLRVLGGFASYAWSNQVMTLTNIVSQAGTYTVTVTNSFGCTGTNSVTVAPLLPPVIQINSTPLCPGDTAVLTAIGGGQYAWSSGQSASAIIATIPGTYSVTVTGVGICTTSTTTVLDFASAPAIAISAPASLNCLVKQVALDGANSSTGPNFSQLWTTLDGHFVSGDSTLNPLVDAPGTYVLSIVNNLSGCIARDTVVVIRDTLAPPADPGLPSILTCSVQNVLLGPVPTPGNPDLLPAWSVGAGGNISSGAFTWAPSVDQPGIYILLVTNALNGCTSTNSIAIGQDISSPLVQIAAPDLITCMMDTVPLNGSGSSSGPGFTYAWTTPNGLLGGPSDSLLSGASSVGTYDLLVTNTLNGCTAIASVTVSADVNIPTASALPPNVLTCIVQNTLIDASASSSGSGFLYQWTTINGQILSGENTLLPTVDAPGLYTLSLLNTDNNCSATLAVIVPEDIAAPIANAGQNVTLNCSAPSTILDGSGSSSGLNYTYQWTTLDGNIAAGQDSLTPVVDQDGTYTLLVTNAWNGCSASASVVIQNDANAPTALINLPATLNCTSQQTQIDAGASSQTGNLSYSWTGNILLGQGTLQITVEEPGVYTLSITNNDNGCSDVSSVTVDQDIVLPTAQAGPDGLLNCYDPIIDIGELNNPSGSGYTLEWSTTTGNFLSSTSDPTVQIDQAGDYQLLITNTQNGCSATDQVSVLADFVPPLADAGQSAVLTCVQTSLNLQGTGSVGPNFNYQWSSNGGNITGGANTLTPTVDAAGIYNLLIINTQNGCSATSQVNITENSNGPLASAGLAPILTCALTSEILDGSGSSTGLEYTYAWSANPGGNITSGANTLTPGINAPGIYTLTVTNANNLCTETASITVLQNIQAPVVNAGLDNMLTCTTLALLLQAEILSASSLNIQYQWSTPNGQILNGGNTANPDIGAPGTYSVITTDALNGCTSVDQLQITEDISPPIVLINNPSILTCAVLQSTLDASGSSAGANFEYVWSSPSGHFVSTQNPQLPVVDEPSPYQLVITNLSNGCTQSLSVTVQEDVQLPGADAGLSIGLDCNNQTLNLDGTGSSQGPEFSYQWTTQNGQLISGWNTLTPSIGAAGNYVLSVLNTQNGCVQEDMVAITQDIQPPLLAIAPPQILDCNQTAVVLNGSGTSLGNAPALLWTSTNGNIVAGATSLSPTVDAPGNYTLTALNVANGCSSSLGITVQENIQTPPLQVQPAPRLTCTVLEIPLTSTVPAQAALLWTTIGGHIVSGANTPAPIVDAPGQYWLTITSAINGCTNSASVTVLQEQNVPTGVAFNLQPPLCNGRAGELEVQQINGGVGPFAYSIDGGQTFFTAQAFGGLTPGNYALVVQDANGCEYAESIQVPSPPIPAINTPISFALELGQNQEIQAIVPASFPLALIDTVIWTPMTGLSFEGNSILELLNPVAQPFHTTLYTVTIVSKEGCKATARTMIQVDREADIYVPNVIWPEDPDSDNATFLVFARDESIALIKKLQIFDRWGSLIFANQDFRPNDPSAGWRGDYKGVPVNPAVFVWWAEVELVDGRSLNIKGDVTIVR